VSVATAQGVPENVVAPLVSVMGPRSLNITIHPPGTPNGQIVQYTVLVVGKPEKYSVTSPQDILIEGLYCFFFVTTFFD
jgi:hypothetical protein